MKDSGGSQSESGQLWLAIAALMMLLIVGAVGFSSIEGWSIWRGLFFTLITVTTVGYSDYGISPASEGLAIFLLIAGVGTASYTFALIVNLVSRQHVIRRRRMLKKISALRNHTIVCGYGRMGSTVCSELEAAEQQFVIIDCDNEATQEARDHGLLCIEGSATEDINLFTAGLHQADHVVVVTPSESDNIVITLTARELNPNVDIVARGESLEKTNLLKRAGANRVVSPFHSGGVQIAQAIIRPGVHELIDSSEFGDAPITFAGVRIEPGSIVEGKSVHEFGASEDGTGLSFVAVERDGHDVRVAPRGNERFLANDHWIVAGSRESIDLMGRLAG